MPLFPTGRQFNPFGDDTPAAKRRRLEAAEGVLSATGFPEVAGFLEATSDAFSGPTFHPKSLRIGGRSFGARVSNGSRTMPVGFNFRRKRRRRVRVSRNFARKVVKVVGRGKETKQFANSVTIANFAAGDGISKALYVFNPTAQLTQGDNANDIDGNVVYLRGIKLKGTIYTDETSHVKVSVWMCVTTQTVDVGIAGTTYGNTTTASTNPAATAPDTNLAQWASATDPEPFVGRAGGALAFDNTLVRIVGMRTFTLRGSGGDTSPFRRFNLWYPINARWQIRNPDNQAFTDQLMGRGLNYYICWQVHGSTLANDIATTETVDIALEQTVYVKEV